MTMPLWTDEQTVYEGSHIDTKLDGRLHEGYVKTMHGIVIV